MEKITRQQAHEALKVYVQQEIERHAISILESVIQELMVHPGGGYNGTRIEIHGMPLDRQYSEMINHAHAFNLGPFESPPWLCKFADLVQQIRKERDLVSEPPKQYDCSPGFSSPGSGIAPC